ncbi:ribosomal protein S17 [Trichinella spiralis]|uniref:ribosomal protein S17 n=1 Tax=Trichinella spiralis TaxID=6334 RepID=UPI0001EFE49B|nr:ribosomal protein S17 [Trichinella spiralis]
MTQITLSDRVVFVWIDSANIHPYHEFNQNENSLKRNHAGNQKHFCTIGDNISIMAGGRICSRNQDALICGHCNNYNVSRIMSLFYVRTLYEHKDSRMSVGVRENGHNKNVNSNNQH